MDDILAVLDAVGSERAALVGCDIGGHLATLFAATYPERTSHLVLVDSSARVARDVDYPIGIPQAQLEHFDRTIGDGWGDPDKLGWLEFVAPPGSVDARFLAWWSRMERLAGTPNLAVALSRLTTQWDLRPTLASI